MTRVNVTIQWPSHLGALPEGAKAHVTVADATRADAGSVVLAEVVLPVLRGEDVTASLEVGEVDPRADVVVRVHVRRGRRAVRGIDQVGAIEVGDLISTQSHPVLTHGHGDSVVVPVTPVRG